MNTLNSFLTTVGRGVGGVVGALYQAGREAIDQVIANILPFMAFISLVIGTLLGATLIANGTIPPQYALPALFAINPQVGCDFIPVGLALGEAEPETVEVGVPAVLFSRFVTGPLAVVIAWLASFGLYAN